MIERIKSTAILICLVLYLITFWTVAGLLVAKALSPT
jgi:hypothetical protein